MSDWKVVAKDILFCPSCRSDTTYLIDSHAEDTDTRLFSVLAGCEKCDTQFAITLSQFLHQTYITTTVREKS